MSPRKFSVEAAPKSGISEPSVQFAVVAKIRIALAMLNFGLVIFGGHPVQNGRSSIAIDLLACAAFLLWTVASYAILFHTPGSRRKATVLPVLDVFAAVCMVTATGGATSPFASWISFMALGTLLVSRWRYAILVGLLAAGSTLLLGLVESAGSSVTAITFVRTAWAGVFALFGYLLRLSQLRHLDLLGALERFSAEVNVFSDSSRALESFRATIAEVAGSSNIVVRLDMLELQPRLRLDPGSNWLRIEIRSGGVTLGEAHVGRRKPFASEERMVLALLGERLASALQRIQTNSDLIDEAARQERLALADEIHDTTIQTLTAIDLGATMLSRAVKDQPEGAAMAQELGGLARDHIAHVRRFLRDSVSERIPGPEALQILLDERWNGPYELNIAEGTKLSEARWRLVLLMVREGLNNALRHGRSSKVSLTVASDGGFEARLAADGISPGPDIRLGYGLSRLRAVASAQQASVELSPRPGGGSILSVKALPGGAN